MRRVIILLLTQVLLWALLAGRGLGLFFANSVGSWSAYLSPEWLLAKWAVIAVGAGVLYLNQRTLRLMLLLTVRRLRRWWRTQVFVR